jgi:DNA (cytosine-5)-methyltransferase 1
MLTVGSLFSGIGGLNLGLERAGMRVAWQSEIDPYACKVLAKHWPEVPNHGNIKEIDWRRVEPVDVICGGYPCQPFSTAGKRRGGEDPRHLWPWVREAISQLRPRYAILENVRGHLSLGGTTVLGELAALGYDAEWRVVSAASVGANHQRERVIIVAYPNSSDAANGRQRQNVPSENRDWRNDRSRSNGHSGQVALASSRQNTGTLAYPNSSRRIHTRTQIFSTETRQQALTELAISSWWTTEPGMGRVANGVPNRVDRLRGLGNAVVPQVAEVIGRLVVAHAEHN